MFIYNVIQFLFSNALIMRKDMAIFYSRSAILTLLSAYFISYNNLFVISLEKGIGLYGGLFNITSLTQSFSISILLLSSIGLSLVTIGSRKKPYLLIFCIILIVSLAINYEIIIDSVLYLVFFLDECTLLYYLDVITRVVLLYNVFIYSIYILHDLGLSNLYVIYSKKRNGLNNIIIHLNDISLIISYLLKIQRIIKNIIYISTLWLIIYKYISSNLCILDVVQFSLFILSCSKVIIILFSTKNKYNKYISYIVLLLYMLTAIVCLPGFVKIITLLLHIVKFSGKGKGRAPDSPAHGSNPSSPSSPPSGPNPPSGTESVLVHDNSNNNQGEEEGAETHIWEPYSIDRWENADQEDKTSAPGPSETPRERRNRLERERRAARTPEQIAKDSEKKRIRRKQQLDNMTEQEKEKFKAQLRKRDRKYRDNWSESRKEEKRQYDRDYRVNLSEEKKLEYAIRAEQARKKSQKRKRDEKKDKDDKDDKTSKK